MQASGDQARATIIQNLALSVYSHCPRVGTDVRAAFRRDGEMLGL